MALSQVGLERLGTSVTDKIGERKNLIINGAMQVAQRGTITGITASQYAGPDRFRFGISGHGTFTVSQDSSAPTGSGFAKSLKLDCTTADTSVASSTAVYFQHKLEGKDCQRIKKGTSSAEQLAVQFHVKSNKTGTYAFQLSDNDNSRTFTTTYSISSADTWEKKTIIIPADTTGALDDDHIVSLTFNFWLVAGTDFTSGAASTTWYSHVNANAAKGHDVNIADSTSNEWYMTGFQVETGSVHTEFEHRSFQEELKFCERYHRRIGSFNGVAASTTQVQAGIVISPEMRATPTISLVPSDKARVTDCSHADYQNTGPTVGILNSSNVGLRININGFTGMTIQRVAVFLPSGTNSSVLHLSAEL
tara:strand:+ start:15 stop:1103 length:1089 start_codon:yes stop_codon:yes gene_type:complete